MPNAGDRIVIEGAKLGQVRREGEVLDAVGSLLKIRWNDGSESLLSPASGTVEVVGKARGSSAKKKATAKAKKPAKKAAAKAKAKKKPAKKRAKKA